MQKTESSLKVSLLIFHKSSVSKFTSISNASRRRIFCGTRSTSDLTEIVTRGNRDSRRSCVANVRPIPRIDGHTQRNGLGLPPVCETERQRNPAVSIDGLFATYDFDIHAIRCYANGSLHSVKRVKHSVKHRPENPSSVIALRRSMQFRSPRQSSVQMRQLTGYQNKKAVISDCLRERKTRLELATPTLAKLCSTN